MSSGVAHLCWMLIEIHREEEKPMYYTDDSLLPENQDPLIITAAPYGPIWMPEDYPEDIPVTWDEQVQKAVDCYNAGATMPHIHVRDPKTGHISKNFKEYGDLVGRLRQAVPKMVLQIGGSISFAPEGDEKAKWQSYDTRHMLAEIDPKPDQVTVAIGSSLYDIRRSSRWTTSRGPTSRIPSRYGRFPRGGRFHLGLLRRASQAPEK